MSTFLRGIAALSLLGAAALPLPANAAERHDGLSNTAAQSTELSAQRRWRGRSYGYRYGPRRYVRPGYGYYGGYPAYGYGGYPYGYAQPGIGIGVGPFGFRAF